MIAYTVSACEVGGITVTRLAAPEQDRPLAPSGPYLHNVAADILVDCGVSLEGPRNFLLQNFTDRFLSVFYGKRAASVTLRSDALIEWAAEIRARLAPVEAEQSC